MGRYIAQQDKLTDRQKEKFDELNIAHCNSIASNVRKLYKEGGKTMVVGSIYTKLKPATFTRDGDKYVQSKFGFTTNQRERSKTIVKQMFRWHWVPWSSIRKNMKHLTS